MKKLFEQKENGMFGILKEQQPPTFTSKKAAQNYVDVNKSPDKTVTAGYKQGNVRGAIGVGPRTSAQPSVQANAQPSVQANEQFYNTGIAANYGFSSIDDLMKQLYINRNDPKVIGQKVYAALNDYLERYEGSQYLKKVIQSDPDNAFLKLLKTSGVDSALRAYQSNSGENTDINLATGAATTLARFVNADASGKDRPITPQTLEYIFNSSEAAEDDFEYIK